MLPRTAIALAALAAQEVLGLPVADVGSSMKLASIMKPITLAELTTDADPAPTDADGCVDLYDMDHPSGESAQHAGWPIVSKANQERQIHHAHSAFAYLHISPDTCYDKEKYQRVVAAAPMIAKGLAPRLKRLSTSKEATSAEMQDKFSQDARGMLEYGNLKVFFRGLEGLVGSPNPNVMAAMAEEHTAGVDVTHEFTTGNYDLTTTSAIEWAFVATPDAPPPTGWPVEQKIRAALAGGDGDDLAAIRASGAQPRQPQPVAQIEASMEQCVNVQLRPLGEPEMTLVEAIGLREYTGPLFVKYNAVVRGLNSKVGFLQTQLIKLCGPTDVSEQFAAGTMSFEQAKAKVNLYTTTLHVINSGIVKTSKLTYACPVYRGVSGMALPEAF